MSSFDIKCSICQKPLCDGKRPEVTLSCKHTFHHQCAKQRLDNENSKDCPLPICRKKFALEHALKIGKCSICQKPLGNEAIPEVTLSCMHTFHHRCAKQRLDNENSKDCPLPICRKKFALEDALKGGSSGHDASASKGKSPASDFYEKDSTDDEWECSNSDRKKSTSLDRSESRNQSKCGPSSALKSAALAAGKSYDDDDSPLIYRQRFNGPDTNPEWACDRCTYINGVSDAVCQMCGTSKQSVGKIETVGRKSNRSPSPDHYSPAAPYSSFKHESPVSSEYDDDNYSFSKHGLSAYSKHDDDDSYSSSQSDYAYHPGPKASPKPKDYTHASDVKPKPSKYKPQPPTSQDPVPVYISGLPLDINDDQRLAKNIRNRVKNSLFIELSDITCYSKLGVGVMYVADNQAKERLTEEIGVLAYDPKGGKTMISFVETLNLVSYIVLDISKEKIDSGLPTADEISRRWAELNNGQRPRACEQLNIQFPNIYRLVSTSLDQIIDSLDREVFKIKNWFAQIYFCADCSFFEEVPRSITENQLQEAVVNAIKEPHISPSALRIQLNKETNTACIITANEARKWATITHLSINDKTFLKKDKLACRLVIYPIPKEVSLQSITQHSVFHGQAKLLKKSGKCFILDILDKNIFNNCIEQGALRVGSNILTMDAFTALNNPDGDEIETMVEEAHQKSQKHDTSITSAIQPERTDVFNEFQKQISSRQQPSLATVPVKTMSVTVNKGIIEVAMGDITTQKVDVIIGSSSSEFLRKAIIKAAGDEVETTYNIEYKNNLNAILISTSPGTLPCKRIFFVKWQPDKDEEKLRQSLIDLISTVMLNVISYKFTSLAFPAIGCGQHGCSVYIVVKTLMKEMKNQLTIRDLPLTVKFVIQRDQQNVYDEFCKQLLATQDDVPGSMNYQVPTTWKKSKDKKIRFELSNTSDEYKSILTNFDQAMKGKYKQIIRIERIQNERWYIQYLAHSHNFKIRLNSDTEKNLYHGCPEHAVNSILDDCFNRSFAGVNGTVYGVGVYFSSNATYSHGYTKPNINGERNMFVARVLVGNTTKGDSSMKTRPIGFDSTTDGNHIFVTYHDAQAYAEYLITYK